VFEVEFLVLANQYFWHCLKGLLLYSDPSRVLHKSIAQMRLAMCMYVFEIEVLLQPWFTVFNRLVKSIITGNVKRIITYILCCYLLENLEHFWFSPCFFCKRLRSCVGLVTLSKLYLRNACLTGTQNILLFLYWTWGMHKKYYPCYFPCYCSNTLLGVWNPTWCCYVDTYACW
jgi:hypothetical protein